MNSKIHSIIIPSSILAFTLIIAGIPTLFESVLAQNDELGEQLQTNDTGLSQGQASEGTSTDSGTSTSTDSGTSTSTDSGTSTSTDSGIPLPQIAVLHFHR